jgi:glycosyltransferase involved in cell wall biosynthesis
MAKAIITLLEDPGRALDMARLAREEVATYTWPKVKKAWRAVYIGKNLNGELSHAISERNHPGL